MQLVGPELEDIAQQASDDALMAIKTKLADFRGESRFTTWAYRFVMFEVSTKLGRHFWRNRYATLDEQGWERLPDVLAVSPHEAANTGKSSLPCGALSVKISPSCNAGSSWPSP